MSDDERDAFKLLVLKVKQLEDKHNALCEKVAELAASVNCILSNWKELSQEVQE